MQTRSDLWIRLASRGTFTLESMAVIGGVEYTTISAPRIDRPLFTENLSVGHCNSATLDLSVMTGDVIPESAKTVIKGRITDGVEYSEWKEFGTFYIDRRDWGNGIYTFLCYDSMRKAEQQYIDPSDPEEEMKWPKAMIVVVEEIAARIGVEIDPRTVINTSEAYQVLYPNKLTMMEILGYIGGCHGGNWIITPENRLRLVPIIPTPETYYILDHAYNRISPSDGYVLVSQHIDTSDAVENPAGGGAVNVPVVIDKISTATTFFISRVTLAVDEDTGYTVGDDTGYELLIDNNPYACKAICEDLYAKYAGLDYQPFEIENACYDPAAELGDWMVVGSDIHSVLCYEYVTMDVNFRANASAPGKDEVSSEYPFLSVIEKLNRQTERLKKYAEQEDAALKTQIIQTRTDILLEVSSTYATQDAVTASVQVLSEKVELKVSKGDVSSQISVESGDVTIKSNRLTIESDNFKLTKHGEVTASGSFKTSYYDKLNGTYGAELDGGGLRFFHDSETAISDIKNFGSGLLISSNDLIILGTGNSGSRRVILNSGAMNVLGYYESLIVENASRFMQDIHSQGRVYFGWYNQLNDVVNIHAGNGINNTGYGLIVNGDLEVYGGIACSGAKYRAVSTKNYGKVGMNAMESANAVFSDMGSVILDENGSAEVFLDPVFTETVDLSHDYYVFMSSGEASKIEKHNGYFTVFGTPGSYIDWLIFYRQKEYTTDRMENIGMDAPEEEPPNDMSVFCGDGDAAVKAESLMDESEINYEIQAESYLNNYEREILEDDY